MRDNEIAKAMRCVDFCCMTCVVDIKPTVGSVDLFYPAGAKAKSRTYHGDERCRCCRE